VSLAIQGLIFAVMFSVGVFVGLWGDLLRVVTRKGNNITKAIADLLFWASIICLVFAVLMQLNFLELRLYAFVSMGLGVFLYFHFLSAITLKFYQWAFETGLKVLKWLWRITLPLRAVLRAIAAIPDIINLLFLSLASVILLKAKELVSSRKDYPPAT
jgi:spore cortex biosynthesis protein YabQ